MVCLSNASSVSWQPNCSIGFVGTSSSWVLPRFESLVALPAAWTGSAPMLGVGFDHLPVMRPGSCSRCVPTGSCLRRVDQASCSVVDSTIPSRTKASASIPSKLATWSPWGRRVWGRGSKGFLGLVGRPNGYYVSHMPNVSNASGGFRLLPRKRRHGFGKSGEKSRFSCQAT
jgi:hypothetical protein